MAGYKVFKGKGSIKRFAFVMEEELKRYIFQEYFVDVAVGMHRKRIERQ